MNSTLAYFGLKYSNPYYLYLATFALTPHPYNPQAVYTDPERGGQRVYTKNKIPKRIGSRLVDEQGNVLDTGKVLRERGVERDLIETLNPGGKLSIYENDVLNKVVDSKGKVIRPYPNDIPEEQAIQAVKKYNLLKRRKQKAERDYTPRQIQAVQRKNILRPKALKLDEKSSVFPEINKGVALENSYNLLRDPLIREKINDAAILDRFYRQTQGQLTPAEQNLPKILPKEVVAAKERLSTLGDGAWDVLLGAHRALNEIRREAEPVEMVISDKTSPINRGAKADTRISIEQHRDRIRDHALRTGEDPRTQLPVGDITEARNLTADVPSYVKNPESIRYATGDLSPEAQNRRNKSKPMVVGYTPTLPKEGKLTGLERRIQRLRNARDMVQNNNVPLPILYALRYGKEIKNPGTPIEDRDLWRFDPNYDTMPVSLEEGDRPKLLSKVEPTNINKEEVLRRNRTPLPFRFRDNELETKDPIRLSRDGDRPVTRQSVMDAEIKAQALRTDPPRQAKGFIAQSLTPPYQEAAARGIYESPLDLPASEQKNILNSSLNQPPAPSPGSNTVQPSTSSTPSSASVPSSTATPRPTIPSPIPIPPPSPPSSTPSPATPLDKTTNTPVRPANTVTETVEQQQPSRKVRVRAAVSQQPVQKTVVEKTAADYYEDMKKRDDKKPKATTKRSTSVQDIYDELLAKEQKQKAAAQLAKEQALRESLEAEEAKKAASKPKKQSLKLRNLLSGFPDLSDDQRKGLLKLGGGVVGAGGVLLGGSLVADSLIKQNQAKEIERQKRLYGNYPAYQPSMSRRYDPYEQQRIYY